MQEAVREAYHATFRAPITMAPKLSSPPPRPELADTIAAKPAPMVTTGGAVARGQTGVGLEPAPTAPRWIWGVVAGIVAFVVAGVVGILLVLPRSDRAAAAGAPSAEQADAAASSHVEAAGPAPTPSSEPVVLDLDALPNASAQPSKTGKAAVLPVPPNAQPGGVNTGPRPAATVAPPAPIKAAPPAATPAGQQPGDMFDKRR